MGHRDRPKNKTIIPNISALETPNFVVLQNVILQEPHFSNETDIMLLWQQGRCMACKTLSEALATIENQFGKNALQNDSRLLAYLTDFLPDQKATRKILESAFSIGISKKIAAACGKSLDEQQLVLSRCVTQLQGDFGFKKELIEDVLWTYARAVGITATPPPTQPTAPGRQQGQHQADPPLPSPPKPTAPATLSQIKMKLRPLKSGNINELLVTRTRIVINIFTDNGETIKYQYDCGAAPRLCEECLKTMNKCLESYGWFDKSPYSGSAMPTYLYELEAAYGNGNTIEHRGVFDRLHIPEAPFRAFIDALCAAVNKNGLGGIIALDGFMMAIEPDEIIYCGVEFHEGGRIYHYRTSDLTICVGDKVMVPVGNERTEKEATVKTVTLCKQDNTPYPLGKTKEIIRKLT